MRHDNAPDWHDKPEHKPFSIELTRNEAPSMTMTLNIGNVALALFRKRPDLDYIAVREEQDEDKDEWTFIFDRHALLYWMGGLAIDPDSQRTLRLVERKSGTFRSHFGWNPDIVIEDYPSQDEVDVYVRHLSHKDLHEDLNEQLKQDLQDE